MIPTLFYGLTLATVALRCVEAVIVFQTDSSVELGQILNMSAQILVALIGLLQTISMFEIKNQTKTQLALEKLNSKKSKEDYKK